MENKKNKKKLFAIIAASALAFVLTIALSVSITLAYFGSTGTGQTKVTLGGSVEVGSALTMTENVTDAVPGQTVSLSINGKIKSSSTQKAAVILLVNTNESTVTVNGSGWKEVTDVTATKDDKTYKVYAYGTSDALTVVDLTATDTTLTAFTASYTVPTTLTNTAAGTNAATVDAIMIAVQNGTSDLDKAKSFETLKTIFADSTVGAGVTFSD